MSIDRDVILRGMATIFWGTNWAQHADEHDCYNLSGCEITKHMPKIPAEVHAFASKVAEQIEKASNATLPELYAVAESADHAAGRRAPLRRSGPERFGECLAFQFTGAGVSWEDDHEPVPGLVVPYGEDYEIRALADELCEEQTDRVQSPYCGCYLEIGEFRRCEGHGYTHTWRGRRPYYVPKLLPAALAGHKAKIEGGRYHGARKLQKAKRRFFQQLAKCSVACE
jgi:hypothetical protein